MENVDLDKIKARIAKLLAMAQDNSSPEEAAIAAERARKLMDKYQLDQFDVGSTAADIFSAEQADKDYKFMPAWRDILAVAVAKYNDCIANRRMSSAKEGYQHVVFKGYSQDVTLAKAMFKFLAESCESQCKSYMQANGYGSYYVAKVGDAFKKGWAQAVVTKIESLIIERDQLTVSAGTALVVIKKQAVEAEFGEAEYVTKNILTRAEANVQSAYGHGWTKGNAQNINQLVD